MSLHSWFENMWWQPTPPPLWLRCIEPVYAALSRAHLKRRAANAIAPALPMISVGNITAGGSGKTPFVLWLAEQLKDKGYQPVILCRGDGGKNTTPILIKKSDPAAIVGDEARMLADLSGCPVIAAADRIAGSRMAAGLMSADLLPDGSTKQALGDILILDDGFQYRQLQRCCDIVLIPNTGIGNGHCIPAGPLRETVTSLMRADIIIRTGSASGVEACLALSDKKEWQWLTKPVDIIDIMHSGAQTPGSVHAITAIARPQRFFDDLKSTGLQLSGATAYPDHHPFKPSDVTNILKHNTDIAITAKDAVKLQALWPTDQPLWLLQQQPDADVGMMSAIERFLPAK